MQEREKEEKQQTVPTDPASRPLQHVPRVQDEDDDPEQIFLRAVAEIDTQPLGKKSEPLTVGEVFEIVFLVGILCVSFMGIVWQCITYPHTLVILYTKAIPASVTTTLDVPTRTLSPVKIIRSATTATTGTGHRDARVATGTLVFYNGSSTPQYVPTGSVFTGSDGVKVTTDQSAIIPAANLPAIGSLPVFAHALYPGSQGNIAAFDINIALSGVLKVRNEAPFTNGSDARTYRAIAAQDLAALTSAVNDALAHAFTTAFPLQPGEEAIPTNCHVSTSTTRQIGEEAQSVTLTASKTCSAVAYKQEELTRAATAAFMKTRPAPPYHLVGSVQTSMKSVTPLTLALSGKWAYTFSQDYLEFLAQEIQGESPARARAFLLKTGVISYASVPNTLASADYINFLVLIG